MDEKSRNELFSRPRTSTKSGPSTPVTAAPPTTAGSVASPAPAASVAAAAAPAASPEKTGIKAISLDAFKLKPKINFKASPLAFDRRDKGEKAKVEKDAGVVKKSGEESVEKSELLAGGKVRDSLLNDDDDMEVDIDAQLDSVLGNIDVTQEEVLFEDVDGLPFIYLQIIISALDFWPFHFFNFVSLRSDP